MVGGNIMKKSIKTVIGICLTLFFLLSVSTEAGKLKRSKVDFSQIKRAADDLCVELEKIEQYFNEVNNTGTFLKKSFSGKKFTWYYFDVDDDFSSENLVEETKKRTIRNIQLEKGREACWKVPIYLNFKPLFRNGKHKSFSTYGAIDLESFDAVDNQGKNYWVAKGEYDSRKRAAKRYIRAWETVFRKKGIPEMKLEMAYNEYRKKYMEPVIALIKTKIIEKMDHLSFRRKAVGREQNFLPYQKVFYAGQGKINLSFSVCKEGFKVSGDTDSEIYSNMSDFAALLDEYVAKGFAVKLKKGDGVLYEDASTNGKYRGGILFPEKSGNPYGEWIPPLWYSQDDLKEIAQAFKTKNDRFVSLVLSFLDLGIDKIVKQYQHHKTQQHTDEF